MGGKKNIVWPELSKIHTIIFDFDGVFTDNKVYIDENGKETVCCNRGDGLGIEVLKKYIRRNGYEVELFILSKEKNQVVEARAKKLGLPSIYGIDDKVSYMNDSLRARGLGGDENYAGLIYLANDLNDLALFRKAGFAVAPSDAHELIRCEASVVLDKKGGQGFVREFVERLLRVESMTAEALYESFCDCRDRHQS